MATPYKTFNLYYYSTLNNRRIWFIHDTFDTIDIENI